MRLNKKMAKWITLDYLKKLNNGMPLKMQAACGGYIIIIIIITSIFVHINATSYTYTVSQSINTNQSILI